MMILVPRDAIISLRTSYAILGEGWSLNFQGLLRIIENAQNIQNNVEITEESVNALFQTFDTDKNDLIDTLELLASLALVSGKILIFLYFFCHFYLYFYCIGCW